MELRGEYSSAVYSAASTDAFAQAWQDPPKDPKQPDHDRRLVITGEKPHVWHVKCHGKGPKQAIQVRLLLLDRPLSSSCR